MTTAAILYLTVDEAGADQLEQLGGRRVADRRLEIALLLHADHLSERDSNVRPLVDCCSLD